MRKAVLENAPLSPSYFAAGVFGREMPETETCGKTDKNFNGAITWMRPHGFQLRPLQLNDHSARRLISKKNADFCAGSASA
ncbi:MAG: hypothetical protein ABR923_03025 [Terracidiphilus sp.]|jgi:hypothetical protein